MAKQREVPDKSVHAAAPAVEIKPFVGAITDDHGKMLRLEALFGPQDDIPF
jgi:hypothetical protein